ncbi:MAG: hypothetical protein IPJ65_38940 [Archangiaceae bacterium]|nr:hypothetical protein [Archangiaceae bacterium]
MPWKVEVMPLLDQVDDAATAIGAVNTIGNEGGKLWGHNTDAWGASACSATRGWARAPGAAAGRGGGRRGAGAQPSTPWGEDHRRRQKARRLRSALPGDAGAEMGRPRGRSTRRCW